MEYLKFAFIFFFAIPLVITLLLVFQAHYMVRKSTACGICGAKKCRYIIWGFQYTQDYNYKHLRNHCPVHKECWPENFHICTDCRFDHEERIIETAGRKPVKIIRREDIVEHVRRVRRIVEGRSAPSITEEPEAEIDSQPPLCPKHNISMELKTRRRDGKKLWGCPKYGKLGCRMTQAVQE